MGSDQDEVRIGHITNGFLNDAGGDPVAALRLAAKCIEAQSRLREHIYAALERASSEHDVVPRVQASFLSQERLRD